MDTLTAETQQTLARLSEAAGPAASPAAARPKKNSLVYIVEGEIAAGKTELTKAIAAELRERGLRVCLVLEPVDRWKEIGVLQKFYADPGRHGYGFQTYVYATRVLGIAEAVEADPEADVYLLERSPATDQIFMELQRDLVDPVEMAMYYTWCSSFRRALPLDLAKARVLYLKTSLENCMDRLARRCRAGEVADKTTAVKHDGSATGGVSIEYQARLRRAHEAFFFDAHSAEFPHMPKSPFPRNSVIEIGPELADGNFRDAGAEREGIVKTIVRKMGF